MTYVALLFAALLCVGCQRQALDITLTGIPAGSDPSALHVLLRLVDQESTKEIVTEFEKRPEGGDLLRFGFYLPQERGTRGDLRVEVHGILANGRYRDWSGTSDVVPVSATGATRVSIAMKAAGNACSKGGWCSENPVPLGRTLSAIWGASEKDIWAVGSFGTILHYDGADWALEDSGVESVDLTSVWGSGADVWAVGRGRSGSAVLHRKNGRWQNGIEIAGDPTTDAMLKTQLNRVWVSGPDEIFVAGTGALPTGYKGGGFVMKLNGAGRSIKLWNIDTPLSAPLKVGRPDVFWGSDAKHLWIGAPGGNGYQVLSYDDDRGSWVLQKETSGEDLADGAGSLNNLSGTSQNDVWLSGYTRDMKPTPYLRHWDGARWSPGPELNQLGGETSALVFAEPGERTWFAANSGVYRLEPGQNLRHIQTRDFANEFWALWAKDGKAWTVGPLGKINEVTDVATQRLPRVVDQAPRQNLNSVWFTGSAVWVGSEDGALLRWDGARWSQEPLGADLKDQHIFLWGSGPQDLWIAASSGRLFHHDGSSTSERTPQRTLTSISAIWGRSPSEVWVVGDGGALRYDGARWTEQSAGLPAGVSLTSVAGGRPGEVWAAGTDRLFRFENGSWTDQLGRLQFKQPGKGRLLGFEDGSIWVSARPDLYYCPVGAACVKRNIQAVNNGGNLGGGAADDVWLLGVPEEMYHFGGPDAKGVPTPVGQKNVDGGPRHHLNSAWTAGTPGTASYEIYLVGQGGTVLHCKGARCAEAPQ